MHNFIDEEKYGSWKSWNAKCHIKDRISEGFLEESRKILWEKEEVFRSVAVGGELVGAFSVYIADSVRELNKKNANRDNLLHKAVVCCSSEFCRFLYAKGCDAQHKNLQDETPIHVAAKMGRHKVLANFFKPIQHEELYHPYFFPSPFRFTFFDENLENSEGKQPIHLAAEIRLSKDHRSCIDVLVEIGKADINAKVKNLFYLKI